MKNALILHGTSNDSSRNWIPWLKKELETREFRVWAPDLPNSDTPNIDRYNNYIFQKWHFDAESVIVGHSSGAVAILGILQALSDDSIVDKALLVAGFTDDLNYPPVKEMFTKPFNWKKIKRHVKRFYFFHSDNDPYVPFWHGEKLREYLGGELIVLPGQGHFSTTTYPGDTYKRFPILLEKILE